MQRRVASTVQYSTVQYITVQLTEWWEGLPLVAGHAGEGRQYSTVHYSTVQYSTVQLTEWWEGLPLVAGHAGERRQVARCRRGDAGGVVPERGTHILNKGRLGICIKVVNGNGTSRHFTVLWEGSVVYFQIERVIWLQYHH